VGVRPGGAEHRTPTKGLTGNGIGVWCADGRDDSDCSVLGQAQAVPKIGRGIDGCSERRTDGGRPTCIFKSGEPSRLTVCDGQYGLDGANLRKGVRPANGTVRERPSCFVRTRMFAAARLATGASMRVADRGYEWLSGNCAANNSPLLRCTIFAEAHAVSGRGNEY
jgi:hypothetical protein